jgi:phosphate transport system protein
MENQELGQHISQQFSDELEEVRRNVLQMGGLVEEQMTRAVRSLVTGDTELASEVVLNDFRVNALEVEIDEECSRIIVLRQPAASDLRLLIAVIKAITDLERIGDEAKRISKMVREELDGSLSEDVRQELQHMGDLVRDMLRLVLDAFARSDVATAREVFRADHKVDVKYISITRHLMTYMAEDPGAIPRTLNVLWAARALERMGDRCENIGEYIFYMVKGRIIRHTSEEDREAELAEKWL